MKSWCLILCMGMASTSYAQNKEISRDWTSFYQILDANFTEETKFRLTASVKVVTDDSTGAASLWAYVVNKNGEEGFFDNMYNRPIQSDEWYTYVIEGEADENADKLYFGGICFQNGQFYFDNFALYVENKEKEGEFDPVEIENASFEQKIENNQISDWTEGGYSGDVRVKEFTISSSDSSFHKNQSLLVEGKGIEPDTTYMIGPANGFSPQIGTLVTMLNNLSSRVEQTVQLLDQEETDFLLDDKANSIGALVMHLAAAEAYYQVFTFEGRGFNEEEKEKWQVALNLGQKVRNQFKGKSIDYYLGIYKEVRQKTIEELQKRDDAWLNKAQPGRGTNNHFSWFHVMEHQSSHLGQILMLKKRFPEEDGMVQQEIDTDH
ncbi:DinB family protein [Tunicatimonas pelagia]|uniref:DinB family protein n=1 Tax=Tunicatimonas pelagia TaxID=931531 RepID=UPI0026667432|nr:DUF664 domain-containing protein [Tunicatimonas pelagia]WKN41129.1 DinB family protein [Tunicatimonas pelagia]